METRVMVGETEKRVMVGEKEKTVMVGRREKVLVKDVERDERGRRTV